MDRERPLFWRASLARAALETGILGGLLLLGLLWQHERLVPGTLLQATLFLTALYALWYAVRLRFPAAPLSRRLAHELGALVVLGALSAFWLLAIYAVRWWDRIENGDGGALGFVLVVLGGLVEFAVFRAASWLWHLWQRLRRGHLLWELTHVQLQLALLLTLLPAALLAAALVATRPGFDLDLVVRTLFPALGVAGAMVVALIAAILPPAVVLSYLSARRTTQRLRDLAGAAAALRSGDYSARSPISGADEVTQLQQDFNAMAADLEATMADLQSERDKVAALLQARRELVATVSHELRTPVATVRSYLESIRAGEGMPEETSLARDLTVIENEIVRLQALIEDLFTLSRAEAGALSLKMGPVDLATAVQRRVEAAKTPAWNSGRVSLVAEVPSDLPSVLADEGRLEQVLSNLLRNAVRHTLPGGIIAVVAAAEDGWIRIEVRDTGEGIDPDDLPHIWERFYRAGASPAGGAGLGLALVKELTEAMGGTVTVESKVGHGTTFTVRLKQSAGQASSPT
jgi:signal transduction histidine kinase